MTKPIINLITSPDKVFNETPSIALINLADGYKEQLNEIFKLFDGNLNLYLSDNEAQVQWLLDIVQNVDYIILDIDNTTENQWLIGYLLHFEKTFYLTEATHMLYNTINVNRIYSVEQFKERTNIFNET